MNLAYLTTVYPSVSHTFIRREILELERKGHSIHRHSIRKPDNCVDPIDHEELTKTFYCLNQAKSKILLDSFYILLSSPLKWLKALFILIQFSRLSERGLITHLAYLAEACVLVREFRNKNITHVHTHFGTNATTVAFIIKLLGDITYSFTAHGPDEFDAPIGLNLKEKIKQSEFVVAISNYGAAQLKRWVSLEQWNKIVVVGCTIDDAFISSSTSISPKEKDKQVVCVARLSAQKGIFILLDALKELKDRGLELNLVLAGDGELRTEIEQRINELGLVEQVEITGWISGKEVKKHISESTGFVMASFAEGLPVVIMEAFALKKPVITTWIAGIPELVKQGRNGWLIPPNNVDELVNALTDFLNTPKEQLDKMGNQGFLDVESTHSVLSEVPKLEKALLHVIGNK